MVAETRTRSGFGSIAPSEWRPLEWECRNSALIDTAENPGFGLFGSRATFMSISALTVGLAAGSVIASPFLVATLSAISGSLNLLFGITIPLTLAHFVGGGIFLVLVGSAAAVAAYAYDYSDGRVGNYNNYTMLYTKDYIPCWMKLDVTKTLQFPLRKPAKWRRKGHRGRGRWLYPATDEEKVRSAAR